MSNPGGSDRNHAYRVFSFLERAAAEVEQATTEFLATDDFEEGGRRAVVVHYRIEAFLGLARSLTERGGAPDADVHMRFGAGEQAFVASLWAGSGDASIGPAAELSAASVTISELLESLRPDL